MNLSGATILKCLQLTRHFIDPKNEAIRVTVEIRKKEIELPPLTDTEVASMIILRQPSKEPSILSQLMAKPKEAPKTPV